jgi:hypothetical protein
MPFLYFIPGKRTTDINTSGNFRRSLEGVGLKYLGLTSPAEVLLTECTLPAAGKSGVLLARKINGTDPAVSTLEAGQVWIDAGGYWVGCDPESPPSPPDVARQTICHGYAIDDQAGRKWTIPVARSPIDGNVSLPADFVFDLQSGTAKATTKTEFDWLWELTGLLHEHWHGPAQMTPAALAAASIQILGVNYRIGPAEANLLQRIGCPLIDNSTAQLITLYCLDNPLLEEQKKKEPTPGSGHPPADGLSSPLGVVASPVSTVPVVPS